jgi:DNA-binding MarR family transcriptional regulator
MSDNGAVDDLVTMLSRAWFSVFLRGAESWARLDVTMPQLKVLMLLGLHGSAPVSSLATRMGVSPPNVTGILDRLEQHGWVRRTNDPTDRRVVRVVLTDEGKAFLEELQEAGHDRLRSRLLQMKAADQRALRQGISSLLDIVCADEVIETHATNGARAKEHARNGAVARAS